MKNEIHLDKAIELKPQESVSVPDKFYCLNLSNDILRINRRGRLLLTEVGEPGAPLISRRKDHR